MRRLGLGGLNTSTTSTLGRAVVRAPRLLSSIMGRLDRRGLTSPRGALWAAARPATMTPATLASELVSGRGHMSHVRHSFRRWRACTGVRVVVAHRLRPTVSEPPPVGVTLVRCVCVGGWVGVRAPPSNPLLPCTPCARHLAGHPAWRDGGTVGRVGRGSGRLRSAASRGVVRPMREVGSPKSAATRMRDEPYFLFLGDESRIFRPVLRSLCLVCRPYRPLVGRDVWSLAFVPYVV